MEDETKNIMALQDYLKTNPIVNHLSRAYTTFYADVLYQDDEYEELSLKDAKVLYQHSYNNDITIETLSLPYYSNFRFSQQHFEYSDGKLCITGVHHDDPSKKYIVTIR